MSEHRWSLIFRTISNGKIGSAPSIMLNAVSMKIKTPVRPTPALENKKIETKEKSVAQSTSYRRSLDVTQICFA